MGVLLVLLIPAQGALPQLTAASPHSPAQSGNNPKESTQAQAVPDIGAQIDEILKQCNEAMNVKVQFQRAAELAQQGLELSEKAGDKTRAANAMVYLGAALSYQGRVTEALAIVQKGLPVARAAGDKKVLEQMLNTAASVIGGMGRYEEALGLFYECLNLARETNDHTMEYISLLNIGEAYVRSDDPDKAELPLQESLRIAREPRPNLRTSNPKKATEMALLNLGGMEMARQHYRAALNYYQQVYESKPESSLWVVAALQGMAASYEQLGEPQKAIEILSQAIPIAEKAASGVEYYTLLSMLGGNREKLGDLDAALAAENKALALIHQTGGDPDSEWQVESRIAHIERALGNNQEALEHYTKSIGGIERLRSVALNTEEGRAGVVERSRATYTETADLLFDMHRQSEALEMAELGRARAFLEMLAVSRSGIPDDLTAEQRQREDAKLARISELQKNLWKGNLVPAEEKQVKSQLTSAEQDLETFRLEMRQSNPRYASVQYPEPIKVAQIQSDLLDDHTALLEFLLGEKRSLVWVVKANELTAAVLPPRKEIEDLIADYRKLLMTPASALTVHQSRVQVNRLGMALYRSLLQPVERAIASSQSLIIVPDGALNYLPFESLVVSSSSASGEKPPAYLVEKFSVAYGPSASALTTVQKLNQESVTPTKILLAFGDPIVARGHNVIQAATSQATRSTSEMPRTSLADDYTERGFSFTRLPFTREEVLTISRLFVPSQRQVYLGQTASEETVKMEKLAEYRYIHFASHGFIDEEKPGRSGILLSTQRDSAEDGVLQMGEIMRLKLNADLVTLSACSTALGKLVSGEGILGLTRAFFYSGARNVTVSLWNVNDAATATFMKAFYENLNHGLPKTAALRQAKLTLLRAKNVSWSHPYFWAAFILVGDGN
jgi:CHAT domain-containing protein